MRSAPDQRSRGRFNANRPSHQQRRIPQNQQSLDSRGPGERIRGTASQIAERYLTLARDMARGEDRVAAESYYQYAEHYIRVSNASREGSQQAPAAQPAAPADAETNSSDGESNGVQVDGSRSRSEGVDPGSTETQIR
jgi:hypothetical protein